MNKLLLVAVSRKRLSQRRLFARRFDSFFQGGKCTEIFIIFAPSKNILAFGSFVVN
ncbi:MAG: hypothetical protein IKQ20_09735 [Bacteroidales bacterium]|nr:hypothetical protein [Bacteroidales bacterium]